MLCYENLGLNFWLVKGCAITPGPTSHHTPRAEAQRRNKKEGRIHVEQGSQPPLLGGGQKFVTPKLGVFLASRGLGFTEGSQRVHE